MDYHVLLFGIILMASNIDGMTLPKDVDAYEAVTTSVNNFGIKFNKVVAEERSGNYICSPLSVDILLSMAYFGAEGNTKEELQQSLQSPTDETIMKRGYQALITKLNNTRKVDLLVANKIFTTTGFQVKHDFRETTRTYFRSETESLDFTKTVESAARINNWTAIHTKNRIKKLFKPAELQDTVMVLANAVHFKGEWAQQFKTRDTVRKPFYINETTTKLVDMMHRTGLYNLGDLNDIDAKYIELPYKNKDMSMFILVPNEISGLANVEENFYNIDFTELIRPMSYRRLAMPKFEFKTELDLKPILRKLNITDMFENTANFYGITDKIELKVGKAIQKAFLKVSEAGTEAAAVTGMRLIMKSAMISPPAFTIDRPFLYAIVLKNGGSINIFNGRVVDPSSIN